MLPSTISIFMLGIFFISGCQKDLTFQLDSVSTSKLISSDSFEKPQSCNLKILATNHLNYGIKLGPKIKVFTDTGEHVLGLDSWGDDWAYLISDDEDKGVQQPLCFKERGTDLIDCKALTKAIINQEFEIELNRCEKIDLSPASCDIELENSLRDLKILFI